MRRFHALACAMFLAGAAPAMAELVIQTPGANASREEQKAQQDRADAHADMRDAARSAAIGDYRGAAEAQQDARQEMRDAQRHERRADEGSSTVIIGR